MRVNITKSAEKQLQFANHLGLLSKLPRVLAFRFPYFFSTGSCIRVKRLKDYFATFLSLPIFAIMIYLGLGLSSFKECAVFFFFLSFLLPQVIEAFFHLIAICFFRKINYIIMVWGKNWQWILKHEILELIQMETKLSIVAHIREISPRW